MTEDLGRLLRAFAFALWMGGGLAILSATRAVFARASSRKEGGDFSGAILARFQAQQVAAAVTFGLAAVLGAQGPALLAGGAAVLLLLASLPIDAALRKLRVELGGSTESLAAGDPLRARFGKLHGISILLLLGQIACAAIGLAAAVLRP